jgi:para-aminobenzoate synthetase component 1
VSTLPPPLTISLDGSPEALAARIGTWPGAALLMGGADFGAAGRWSILTALPSLTFMALDDQWMFLDDHGQLGSGVGALRRLAAWLDELRLADPGDTPGSEDPPFLGGLIGYLGYDLAPRIERLPRRLPRDPNTGDIMLRLHDAALVVDHERGTARLHSFAMPDESRRDQRRRLDQWRDRLHERTPTDPLRSEIATPRSNYTRAEYVAAVRRALEYIAAGDIFQVNLSQRFEADGSFDPLDLFLRLRRRSPAPYSAFLRLVNGGVISASPELFYQTRGDHILTRPIKGTRPRGATPDEDRRLADELRGSVKDRAELTMIVDLERNDLGRVCRYGSVRVVDPWAIESFAQVHHLVATVEGRLRPGAGPVDVVRAMFPGGSITGAPKIRAMQIIDELERCRRGVYTGAIGYFSRGGMSAFNIAIRTMVAEPGRVTYQVGGGIVADSEPEAEYEETLHKGRALREVLEGWGIDR